MLLNLGKKGDTKLHFSNSPKSINRLKSRISTELSFLRIVHYIRQCAS